LSGFLVGVFYFLRFRDQDFIKKCGSKDIFAKNFSPEFDFNKDKNCFSLASSSGISIKYPNRIKDTEFEAINFSNTTSNKFSQFQTTNLNINTIDNKAKNIIYSDNSFSIKAWNFQNKPQTEIQKLNQDLENNLLSSCKVKKDTTFEEAFAKTQWNLFKTPNNFVKNLKICESTSSSFLEQSSYTFWTEGDTKIMNNNFYQITFSQKNDYAKPERFNVELSNINSNPSIENLTCQKDSKNNLSSN
jgi:hypothetical protein